MSYPVNLMPLFEKIIKKHAEAAISVYTNLEETIVSVKTDKAKRTYIGTDSFGIVSELEQFLEEAI